jgi:branched-subunit amino acid aminotransferase/4-amino-4-deoxychorismate lyase
MSKYLNLNGHQLLADQPVIRNTNRAFCYGDGIFETIRCLNSQPLFFDKHYQRLRDAAFHLKIDFPAEFTEDFFRQQIYSLLQRNRIYKGARARLSVFRADGGLYTPQDNTAKFLITVEALSTEKFELNQSGLHIDIYKEIVKPVNLFSGFKTSNALLFVMAGIWKKESQIDDCLILNQNGLIIEALASSIYLVKNNILVTPSVESGCVEGTMRRTIFELAKENNIQVVESEGFGESHLINADEIFISNAIAGIQWVGAYKEKRYFHGMASKLQSLLNEKVKEETSI